MVILASQSTGQTTKTSKDQHELVKKKTAKIRQNQLTPATSLGCFFSRVVSHIRPYQACLVSSSVSIAKQKVNGLMQVLCEIALDYTGYS